MTVRQSRDLLDPFVSGDSLLQREAWRGQPPAQSVARCAFSVAQVVARDKRVCAWVVWCRIAHPAGSDS